MCEKAPCLTPEQITIITPFVQKYIESEAYSFERKEIITNITNQFGNQFTERQIRQWIQNRISRAKRNCVNESERIEPIYKPNSYTPYIPNQVPNYKEVCTAYNDPFYEQNTYRDENYVWICYKKEKRIKNLWTMYFKCSKCNSKMNIVKKTDGTLLSEYKCDLHTEACAMNQKLVEISEIHLQDIKAEAIKLYRDSQGAKSENEIAAEIAHVVHSKHVEDPQKLVPRVTPKMIRNWLISCRPVKEKDLMDFQVPNEIQMPDGKSVYHRQSKTNPSLMHFFYTDDAESMAKETPVLLLDGTFRTAPPGYYQVFNGQGYDLKSRAYYPIFHIILQGSDEATYVSALLEIIPVLNFNNLKKVLVDFELASINAIIRVIQANCSNEVVQGCYFHFTQAIRKKFEKFPSEIKSTFQKFFEAIILTPFISYENISILTNFLDSMELLQQYDFMTYWYDTWGFNGLFKPELWNTFNKIDKEIITTDGIERFHRELDDKMSPHPRMSVFIKTLFEIDMRIQHQVQNSETSAAPLKRKTQNEYLDQIKKLLGYDIDFKYEPINIPNGIFLRPPILRSSVNVKKPAKAKRGRPPKNISKSINEQKRKYQKKAKKSDLIMESMEFMDEIPQSSESLNPQYERLPNHFTSINEMDLL